MTRPTLLASLCIALGVGTIAAATISRSDSDKPAKKKDAVAAALDTLEAQLQRRFHDRNNLSFGYERVIRFNARQHNTTVMDLRPHAGLVRDDGTPVPTKQEGGKYVFEIEPGRWVPQEQLREKMHAENDDERASMQTLSKTNVAVYTAGLFNIKDGKPLRLKGPAYLRNTGADAPAKDSLKELVAKGWASANDADELRQGGWTFRIVKVKADDQSCVNCHTTHARVSAEQYGIKPYAINEPVGVFVIGTKN